MNNRTSTTRKHQLLFVSIRWQFFIPPLDICVSTWWRTSGKGWGFAGLPLQPVNLGLKVEVRSCRQIYVETYEKKNNNLHLQKFIVVTPLYCTFDLNLLSGPWKLRITGNSQWDYCWACKKIWSPTWGILWGWWPPEIMLTCARLCAQSNLCRKWMRHVTCVLFVACPPICNEDMMAADVEVERTKIILLKASTLKFT